MSPLPSSPPPPESPSGDLNASTLDNDDTREEMVLKYKDMGTEAFKDRQFESSIDYFTRGIALDQTNAYLYSNRSAAYLCAGDCNAALRDAEEVIRLKPDWAKGYMRKGHALLKLEQPRLARACFEQGLVLEPDNETLRDNIALCDESESLQGTPTAKSSAPTDFADRAGDASPAPSSSSHAMPTPLNVQPPPPVAQEPVITSPVPVVNSPQSSQGPGDAGEQGRTPAVHAHDKPATAENDGNTPRSTSESGTGDYKTDPIANATHHKHLGNQAFAEGQYADAVKHFSLALAADPSNHLLYSNRSAAYASLQDYNAALKDAERTIELMPNWSKGYARKGLAWFHLHRYDEALATYEAGLEVDPGNGLLVEARDLCIAKLNGTSMPSSNNDNDANSSVTGNGADESGDINTSRQEVKYKDGLRYVGDFKDNRFHGNGRCQWPDGSSYTGEFARGIKHGFGTFDWPTGHRYRGMYENDKKHGNGVFEWPDGSRYEGTFYKGVQQGTGTKTDPDGTSYHGEFYNDQMHGRGVTTYPDGTQSEDVYEHGTRVSSVTTLDTEPGNRDRLPPGAEIIITGVSGPLTGREIKIRRPLVSIGSVKVATLRITGDTSLSSLHSVIAFDRKQSLFTICDLNSSNGTILNGRSLSRPPPPSGPGVSTVPVTKGDTVSIGSTVFEIGERIMEPGKSGKPEPIGLHLHVVQGPHRGRHIEIFKYASIGSASANEVALPGDGVSPFHAILFSRQGEYYCKDLNSQTGTRINSDTLLSGPLYASPPAPLARNDTFTLGSSQFRVVSVAQPHSGGASDRRQSGTSSGVQQSSPYARESSHEYRRESAPAPQAPKTRVSTHAAQQRDSLGTTGASPIKVHQGPVPLEKLLIDFREWALSIVFRMFDSSDLLIRQNATQLMSLALIAEGVNAVRGRLSRPAADVCQHILAEYVAEYGCRFPMSPLAISGDLRQREYESQVWLTRRRTVEGGCEDMDVVDAFLGDLDAQDFWTEHFRSNIRVSAADFLHAFRKHFYTLEGDIRDHEHGLQLLLDWNRDDEVSIYEFDVFLRRFGPFKRCAESSIDCLSQPWFHRVYTNNNDVQRLLLAQPRGAFFVRFCMSDLRQFLLCFKSEGQVVFETIESTREGFRLIPTSGGGTSEPGPVFPLMSELVAANHNIARIPITDPALAHMPLPRHGGRGERHRSNRDRDRDYDSQDSDDDYSREGRRHHHRHHHGRGLGSHDQYGREIRYEYTPDEIVYDSARHRPRTQPFGPPGATAVPVAGSAGLGVGVVRTGAPAAAGHTPHPGVMPVPGARTVTQPGGTVVGSSSVAPQGATHRASTMPVGGQRYPPGAPPHMGHPAGHMGAGGYMPRGPMGGARRY